MSFYTSIFASHFPENFKIRKDSSSVGSRIYSTVSDIIEDIYYENYLLRRFTTFHNRIKQIESLWEIELESKDFVEANSDYSFPLLFVGNEYYERSSNTVDFLEKFPFSVSKGNEKIIEEWLLWDSNNPETFNDINEAEHITIDCTGLGKFVGSNKFEQKEYEFFGNYEIIVKGYDELYNKIEERFAVVQKEVFLSNKTFKEIYSVEWDGFEGEFQIYLTSKMQAYKKLPLEYNYIENFGKINNLKLSLFEENGKSYFRIEQMLYRNALFYSAFNSLEDERDVFLMDRVLKDDSGSYIKVIDFTKCPNNKYYYALDDNNTVHCFGLGLQGIERLRESSNKSNFLRFIDLENRVGLFEEIEFALDFKNYIGGIESYRIYRYDPVGVKTFLQSDGTWNASSHVFNFNLNLRYVDRGSVIAFSNYFDMEGQWEFYIEAEYKEFDEKEIVSAAVVCEYMQAQKSYQITDDGTLDGIFHDKAGILSVSKGKKYFNLDFEYKRFNYSPIENRVILLSEVEEVEFLLPVKIGFYKENYILYPKLNNLKKNTVYLKANERHCFIQSGNTSWKEELYFSLESERSESLSKPEILPEYYIDGLKSNVNEYSSRINNQNYDTIEIIIPIIEENRIYCYSRTNSDFKITVIFTDKSIFKRLDNNYGYLQD